MSHEIGQMAAKGKIQGEKKSECDQMLSESTKFCLLLAPSNILNQWTWNRHEFGKWKTKKFKGT